MKILKILLGVLLLSGVALASNNVEIHVNYPADTVYIGGVNKVEIWIENDEDLTGISLAFAFTGYDGVFQWIDPYNPFIAENDADGRMNLAYAQGGALDSELPDTLLHLGFAVAPETSTLLANPLRACYYKEFVIPAGENPGQLCIDNIFYYPAGDWLFVEEGNTNYAPNYFGCPNGSPINPNCPEVCFPVSEIPAPVAQFSFTPDMGDAPLSVEFTDFSTNSPTGWLWYFGDGQTSMEQNPTHVYQDAGVYFPKLVVSNLAGSDSVTSAIPVTVTTPVEPPGIFISCPDLKQTYAGITDTIPFLLEYTGTETDDFTLTVNDSQGWFLSPTYLQFSMDPDETRTVKVMVIVPENVPYLSENTITMEVVSQSNPATSDMASCVLQIVSNICGDVNLDGGVNVSDAVFIINYVFLGGPAPCDLP